MANFDLKSFMINEGLTRVSRDRKKLVESIGYGYEDDFDEFEDHEIDQELLSALEAHSDAEGYGSLNGYSWFYNQGDPIIDTVNGQSFKLSNATEDEETDLWLAITKAGWILNEDEESVSEQDYEAYREWQKDNGWDDETINAAIEIWKQHPDMFAIELENPIVDDLEAFVAEPELYLSGDPEDLATAVKQNIYRR